MANKYAAKGATVEHGGAASATASYSAVDGVQSLGIPSDSADLIDVTSHDSSGGRKEYVNGLIDTDDLSIAIVYDSADTVHEALRAAAGGVAQHFRISLANGTTNDVHTFSALVMGFAINLDHDGAEMATITLKRTGADAVSSSA